MEAIILAGGLGTRLRSVIDNVPKPMADINSKPFLCFILENLYQYGFRKIILSIGYKGDLIVNYFGTNYKGVEIVYVMDEIPLGTGGAIKKSMQYIVEDHAFIINGDTFCDIKFSELEDMWCKSYKNIMTVVKKSSTLRFGKVKVSEGYVLEMHEKNSTGSGLINAGCYVLSKIIFENSNGIQRGSFETGLLAKLISNHEVLAYIHSGEFIDIGIPEDYAKAQVLLKNYA